MAQLAPAEAVRGSRARDAIRFTLLSPVAIGLITALCIVGNRLRVFAGFEPQYGFIVLNLFLAWIPLGLAYSISWAAKRGVTRSAVPLLAGAWIIFLPNAPYLVTDVVHLQDGVNAPNAIVLGLLALTGLLIGVKSVQLVQRAVERLWGAAVGRRAVQVIAVLAALGVYVGRVLRWNSWTIILDPHRLAHIVLTSPSEPGRVLLGAAGILVFAVGFYVAYRLLTGPRGDNLSTPGPVARM